MLSVLLGEDLWSHLAVPSESHRRVLSIQTPGPREALQNVVTYLEDLLRERESIALQMGKFRYDTGETITFDSEREDRVRQDRGSQLEAILGRSLSDQETLVSNTFWTRVMEMSRDLQKPENCKDTLLLAWSTKESIRLSIDGTDTRICPVLALYLQKKDPSVSIEISDRYKNILSILDTPAV